MNTINQNLRIFWLPNPLLASSFDIHFFKKLGKIFLYLPYVNIKNEDIEYLNKKKEFDSFLKIKKESLEILNVQNWYYQPTKEAWSIVESEFDLIIINSLPDQVSMYINNCRTPLVYRYLKFFDENLNHLTTFNEKKNKYNIRENDSRLLMASCFLKEDQSNISKLYLPNILQSQGLRKLQETNAVITFCSYIETSAFAKKSYTDFLLYFGEKNYFILGQQLIEVKNKKVINDLSMYLYVDFLKKASVVLFKDYQPGQLDSYAFEAMRMHIPVIYFANEELDIIINNNNSSGRAVSYEEAYKKVDKVLKKDHVFINRILADQQKILNNLSFDRNAGYWLNFLTNFEAILAKNKNNYDHTSLKVIRIAVIVNEPSDNFNDHILLMQALKNSCKRKNQDIQLIYAYSDSIRPAKEKIAHFGHIKKVLEEHQGLFEPRKFEWKILDKTDAQRSILYSKQKNHLSYSVYQVPDDGMQQLTDCNCWILTEGNFAYPLLPLRPYILLSQNSTSFTKEAVLNLEVFAGIAQEAYKVITNTAYEKLITQQFLGISSKDISMIPPLIPTRPFDHAHNEHQQHLNDYFIIRIGSISKESLDLILDALFKIYTENNTSQKCIILSNDENIFVYIKKLLKKRNENNIPYNKIYLELDYKQKKIKKLLNDSKFIFYIPHENERTNVILNICFQKKPILIPDQLLYKDLNEILNLNLFLTKFDSKEIYNNLKNLLESNCGITCNSKIFDESYIQYIEDSYWNEVSACL
ncbi:hypothetical protein [uncultured Thiothrix sp.]|uniref:hypothetical protein n=1 Tax=uncultured Thiothrix sp. TaxID=223185 RepID=UPI002611AA1E|nr:hypothetical protein [uncultured Thiothrix sp.]